MPITTARSPKSPSAQVRPRNQTPALFFNRLRSLTSSDWTQRQKSSTLALVRRMAREVPAYRAFLKEGGQAMLRALDALHQFPIISKVNYVRKNRLADLSWNGSLKMPQTLTSTSGSTGQPTYFSRSPKVDDQASLIHELIFRTSSLSPQASTLVLVCFGMGVWIGGVITYQAFSLMGRRGYPLSVLTPGINKTEIFKALADVLPHYDQLVLAGYPPFLKDVLDEASSHGVSFEGKRLMLLFAAEAFSEPFRDYMGEKARLVSPLTDAVNIYGTADLGAMAFETPLSILARRLALKNKRLFAELFSGTSKTPTLAQYVPDFVSFETTPEGEVLVSGDSAVPLARYSIGDHGGVYTYRELVALFKAHGTDLMKEARKAGIKKHIHELPFVYVYERIDLATTLYGLQVYPETVREALLDRRFVPHVTGKIAITTKYDHNQDQYLEIHVEQKLRVDVTKVLAAELLAEIVKSLREKNSEFRELYNSLGKRAEPRLVFWPYEDPLYFKPGIKQQWVVRPD